MNRAQRLWQVQADSVPPSAWRNGGGQTRELLRRPEGGEWQLRVSLADISRDGPFSAFPGIQRWFGVVAGAGVSLRFGNELQRLTADSPALQFDGAAAPECSLLDGPTRDLNLMACSGNALMVQVQANRAWDEPWSERGLFTLAEGTLHRQGSEALPLAKHTLAWFLGAGACRFEPRSADSAGTAGSTGKTGWWLGWSPEETQRK